MMHTLTAFILSIIDVLFFCLLFGYLIWKKVIIPAYHAREKDIANHAILAQEKETILAEIEVIKTAIMKQEKYAQHLLINVDHWHNAYTKKYTAQEMQAQDYAHNKIKNHTMQYHAYIQEQEEKKIVRQAYIKACHEIAAQFHDPVKKRAFLQTVIEKQMHE